MPVICCVHQTLTHRTCANFDHHHKSCALQSVRVCMIDTGTDLTHPDIMSNLWVNQAELNGKPGVDDDNNGDLLSLAGPACASHIACRSASADHCRSLISRQPPCQ